MAFQRKLLPGRIVVENSRYAEEYRQTILACQVWTLHDLRAALAQIAGDWRLQGTRGSRYEAIISLLIQRRDFPQLKDSTGRVWT